MAFGNNYSALDRLLHRLAFATPRLQRDFAESEDRAFLAGNASALASERPVFITALPRAGTTLLLNILAPRPEFAAHTYRDMPFLLMPLQWDRFSAGFRKPDQLRERAHGDGVMVSADSPEAFEEMLWMAFWPGHYRADRIMPWEAGEADAEFTPFLRTHMRKIAALRRPGQAGTRYISKNNVNMARLAWLQRAFPGATVVVPYRDPFQHAASLLRQHRNFLAMHAEDPFSRRYMAGVGHHDFGANLKPIDFGGWMTGAAQRDPLRLDFWLAYWVAAYEALLAAPRDRVLIVGYERLCEGPAEQLAALHGALGIAMDPSVAADIRPLSAVPIDTGGIDGQLIDRARDVHRRLEVAHAFA